MFLFLLFHSLLNLMDHQATVKLSPKQKQKHQ